MKIYESEIQWNQIQWIGLKIREKSLFEKQQKSTINVGQKEEITDLKTLITYLNSI